MRRRIGSAASPLHAHALPQLLVDGVLVALAWFLAFQLRFGGSVVGVPSRFEDLFWATVAPAVIGALVVFTAFRMYLRGWRYISQHDYAAILQAVLVATLFVAGYTALVK